MGTTKDDSLDCKAHKINSAIHRHVIGGATIFKFIIIIISFATGMQTKGNSYSGTNLEELHMGTCLQKVTKHTEKAVCMLSWGMVRA